MCLVCGEGDWSKQACMWLERLVNSAVLMCADWYSGSACHDVGIGCVHSVMFQYAPALGALHPVSMARWGFALRLGTAAHRCCCRRRKTNWCHVQAFTGLAPVSPVVQQLSSLGVGCTGVGAQGDPCVCLFHSVDGMVLQAGAAAKGPLSSPQAHLHLHPAGVPVQAERVEPGG